MTEVVPGSAADEAGLEAGRRDHRDRRRRGHRVERRRGTRSSTRSRATRSRSPIVRDGEEQTARGHARHARRRPVLTWGSARPQPLAWAAMSDVAAAPLEPPRAHARVVYLGPVAPHWEIHSDFGDRQIIEEFRGRVLARLVLLPPARPAVPPQPGAGDPRRRAGEHPARLGPRPPRGRRVAPAGRAPFTCRPPGGRVRIGTIAGHGRGRRCAGRGPARRRRRARRAT